MAVAQLLLLLMRHLSSSAVHLSRIDFLLLFGRLQLAASPLADDEQTREQEQEQELSS